MTSERLFPPVSQPVRVPDAERFLAARILDPGGAAAHVRRAVLGSALRPSDMEHATDLHAPRLLFVPFWRVEISVDGFHLDLGRVSIGAGPTRIPLPTGGARHEDAVILVSGRRMFPYEPKLPTLLGGVVDGVEPLAVGQAELGLAKPGDVPDWAETVDADVTKDGAQKDAAKLLLRRVMPGRAIYAKYEPMIRSTAFCLYPVYYARYRYEGEARRHAGEAFFVAVSGRTGKVIAAHHPSALRATVAKVRKLLTFG